MVFRNRTKGFTLIELMIALAIMFTVAAIAIPAYRGYIAEGHYGVMRTNMHDMRILLEDYRLDNADYGTPGTQFTEDLNSSLNEISTQYGWNPSGNIGGYSYTVAVRNLTVGYDVWASHVSGLWARCDRRISNCCEGNSGTPSASACP